MEDPEVGQTTAGHAAVDDEARVGPVLVGVGTGRVGLSRGRSLAVTAGDVPLHYVRVGPDLQGVEVIEISVIGKV